MPATKPLRPARAMNKGFDLRPLIAILVSVLPLSLACGDDSGTTSGMTTDSTCQERGIEDQVLAYGFCGCNEQSMLAAKCSDAGRVCLFDDFGSVCSPSCDASGMCPGNFYESAFCDSRTNRCLIPCDGGDQGFNCPFGMECTAANGLYYCSHQGN